MAATVLVVDAGGRAAALVYKYSQSKHVQKLLVVPGNDLIRIHTKKPVKIFPHLKTTDTAEIVEIAKKAKVDLVDVAQDDAVACGLSDSLTRAGIKVFGPTKSNSSKIKKMASGLSKRLDLLPARAQFLQKTKKRQKL